MSAEHSVGSDEDQVGTPVPTDGADGDPEQLLAGAEAGPLAGGPGQAGELLTAEQVIGDQVASPAHRRADQVDEQEQVFERGEE